jgi:hypothetical protein
MFAHSSFAIRSTGSKAPAEAPVVAVPSSLPARAVDAQRQSARHRPDPKLEVLDQRQ